MPGERPKVGWYKMSPERGKRFFPRLGIDPAPPCVPVNTGVADHAWDEALARSSVRCGRPARFAVMVAVVRGEPER